ncbi:hypothetical protein Rhopal_005497-T1 [Rhodotorula paludigena]|uniref:A1 cistron-splicing factor n=1 Tax=Rhodotorula paludigena TaxID=86838 RepID=A0AAV5GTU9_9BASI|nr:hypothetical protein Rhopal_005497-T1 [Rhodotorula paludigena]
MDQLERKLLKDAALILTGLPRGSEFGLDGRLWQVDRFSGVKMLPAGFHFFVFSAAPASAASDPSSSQGVAARHGLLRFFEPGERLVQEWDNTHEELKRTAPPKKRRRTARASSGSEAEATLVSDDYLKRLDSSLAPYPSDALGEQWRALAGFVTEETVARVVGLDEQRCGVVDALTSSAADEAGMAAGAGQTSAQRTWGKARGAATAGEGDVDAADPQPDVREVVELDKDGEEGGPELLEFVKFDERRSWPRGAVGEELTHWSKDKSWQLSEVVRSQLNDDPKELLAELQLAFVLFSLVHNFSSLSTYKSLFSLICRSATLVYPPSSRPTTTSLPSPLLSTTSLPLFASFLSAFHAQVDFLDETFFSAQLPSLEQHLLDSLAELSQALSDALPAWEDLGAHDAAVAGVWNEVIRRWDALAALTTAKFGWDLGVVRGSRAKYLSAGGRAQRAADEVDLEDLEEGEDAPVVLDEEGLGEYYG